MLQCKLTGIGWVATGQLLWINCYSGLFYRDMVLIFEMSTERKTEPDEQPGY